MRINSIRTRITLILVTICVIVVLVLGSIWLFTTRETLKDHIYETNLQEAHFISNYIVQYIGNVTSDIELTASDRETINSILEYNESTLAFMANNLLKNTENADLVAITDEKGKLLYVTKPTNITDVLIYEWFNETIKRNKTYISPIFYSFTAKDYVFAVSSPVYESGKTIGIVNAVIKPGDLQESILGQQVIATSDIIVIDETGRVIIHSNESFIRERANLSSYLPFREVLKGKSDVVEYRNSWDQQPRYAAYAPIKNIGWGVVISTPTSIIYRPLEYQTLLIFATLVFSFLLSFVMGNYASKRISEPIIELSNSLKSVAKGDYSVRVKDAGDDEIGELARISNKMLDEIKARDQKIMAEKERSELFLDLMSHDISNHNQAILGFIEMAMLEENAGELKQLLQNALGSVNTSNQLITNVKKLRDIQNSRLDIKKMDLNDIIETVLNRELKNAGKDVTVEYGHVPNRYVRGCELLHVVFQNIIDNSIRYSGDKVTIWIDIDKDGGFYVVSIADDGKGIHDEVKQRLFYRMKKDELTIKGKGVGMYLSKMIMEQLEGDISVEDRIKGDYRSGTRFILKIPAFDQEQ
ncbi:hypothetical protein CUJ83_01850 [Methanocella sp. CWC-04]|uniref:histidine kinase n=1 Tax=Methanooceanicella nereidis TaxID=2052831 RepID=A0AAP2RAH5_9EURY|nr:sensor histidine kinase [Methanocella sp. CWC-04]MCD1293738.1 hypothetical protein [Methanocella sp. CWC-04]